MQLVKGGEEAAALPLGFPCVSAAPFIIHEREGVTKLPRLEYHNPYLLERAVLSVSVHASHA